MPKEKPIDLLLDQLLKSLPQYGQVQYSTKNQLEYLYKFAVKFGLYDAADLVKKVLLKQ